MGVTPSGNLSKLSTNWQSAISIWQCNHAAAEVSCNPDRVHCVAAFVARGLAAFGLHRLPASRNRFHRVTAGSVAGPGCGNVGGRDRRCSKWCADWRRRIFEDPDRLRHLLCCHEGEPRKPVAPDSGAGGGDGARFSGVRLLAPVARSAALGSRCANYLLQANRDDGRGYAAALPHRFHRGGTLLPATAICHSTSRRAPFNRAIAQAVRRFVLCALFFVLCVARLLLETNGCSIARQTKR